MTIICSKLDFINTKIVLSGSLDAHQLMELMQSQGVRVRLLDLKRGDIRPGLANLRNMGIENFIVDIGAEYLKVFFEEVSKQKVSLKLSCAPSQLIFSVCAETQNKMAVKIILTLLLCLELAWNKELQADLSQPKEFLDKVTQFWFGHIPKVINASRSKYEKDTKKTYGKKITQGWSIVIGSW